MHIPYDRALTPPLIDDLFRTLRSGGVLTYATSTGVSAVIALLQNAGFVNVMITRLAPRTLYRGRSTMPTQVIQSVKP